ncbi:uncharacterized protein F4822DRAFT_396927 [Hypoxylon trugodes]|uniref:uncharacterized protein n=1 Tax=Hypoxylon trugodes TaxID=326681 RepID=UPI00219AF792|nr:uncharacterized protein F4822DRAFT_396927 [Hypoxylon trugodes]KAI1391497.1 hypothetical protein F4822DRAFT_396927 [Hypoxylon trugodes]
MTSEDEKVAAIVNDDTPDFGSKIDRISEETGWFGEGNATIDAFLAGHIDAAMAARTLTQPIDVMYSSGDRLAKQNQSEGQEVVPELEWTECQLWNLWYSILHSAKRIPYTEEARHGKLLDLVTAIHACPDPPAPKPRPRDWIYREDGKVWSALLLLGPSGRESWNDCPGCGAGWSVPERCAWVNVNAWVARLTAEGPIPGYFAVYGLWALGAAFESPLELPEHTHRPRPSVKIERELLVETAAVWVKFAGKYLYSLRDEEMEEKEGDKMQVSDLNTPEAQLPWRVNQAEWTTYCKGRWDFWKRRFKVVARGEGLEDGEEALSGEIRELAAEAAQVIRGLLGIE